MRDIGLALSHIAGSSLVTYTKRSFPVDYGFAFQTVSSLRALLIAQTDRVVVDSRFTYTALYLRHPTPVGCHCCNNNTVLRFCQEFQSFTNAGCGCVRGIGSTVHRVSFIDRGFQILVPYRQKRFIVLSFIIRIFRVYARYRLNRFRIIFHKPQTSSA